LTHTVVVNLMLLTYFVSFVVLVVLLCVVEAVEQMEEQLSQFIDSNHLEETDVELDGAARFVQHQVVELARDCLATSQSKHLSTSYFCDLSVKLEQLLHDVSTFTLPRFLSLLEFI